jgi:EKC/KEOPS complex subunit PCC1/LAGE3
LTLTTPAPEAATEPQEKKQKQEPNLDSLDESKTVLQVNYYATTNRMLRVAVNGFMESMGVILGAMAELDVDVLEAEYEE